MKKKLLSLALLIGLLASTTVTANAQTLTSDKELSVEFTNKKQMKSTFDTETVYGLVSDMQPGDTAVIDVKVKNTYGSTTDWYLENEIVRSFEDKDQLKGGAYAYTLTYVPNSGDPVVIYDSKTVGGTDSAKAGLHNVSDQLDDYIYLGGLPKNAEGTVSLEVYLDGETQGNAYQSTLADLKMRFGVEIRPTSTPSDNPPTVKKEEKVVYVRRNGMVKTGDESKLTALVAAAGISGLLLLIFALYAKSQSKKDEKGVR